MAFNDNNKNDKAFDMLVHNVETLASTVQELHGRVSKIEGGLIILKIIIGTSGIFAFIISIKNLDTLLSFLK